MSKILLTTLNAKYIHMNLAIRILYDLNRDKADLHWCEFTIKTDCEEIARYCAEYEVVCFSCYIWNITETLAICAAIKRLNPNTKTLLGGPEVSYEYEPVIVRDDVDFIIVGEGEIPFAQFVAQYPKVEQVPNLIRKTGDYSVHYNKQQISFDIKELGERNPYQYDDVRELYNKVCYIETSRGCPYKCEFCLASLDNKVRYLPMQTIKDNLKYLMDHGRTIKFLDRTFNIKKDFTIELFQFILDHHKPGNVFQFEITADIVHKDIIAFINEKVPPGLFRFEIGIQTVNQESNLEVSRKQNFDKTTAVINQLKDRIEMHLDLIVGLPLEYFEDLKYSFESTFKLYPPELQLGFLKFLKGTPVREKYQQYGYKFDPNPPYQIIESNFMSKEELYQVTLLEKALEIYWNKKRAMHTLKYVSMQYSIFDFLRGLGAYFETQYIFHKQTLKEVYQAIYDYIALTYPDDIYLKELLNIDYYAYKKIRPQNIFNLEIEKEQRIATVAAHGLDQHKFRHVLLNLHFDYEQWLNQQEIVPKADLLAIAYDGQALPEIFSLKSQEILSLS